MSMADFDDSEFIHGSELQENENQATLRMLRGGYTRLAQTKPDLSVKLESMKTKLDAMQNTLSQLCNQLGIHPIDAEFTHHVPPVTNFSDPYVHDDVNRLSLDNRKNLSHKIEMPKFDGSNAYEWLSKVERFFHVGRYSDCDKLNLVPLSLEGDALKWFNWQLIRREFRSWEDFRRRLFRKFGAAPAEASGNRLFALKQKGSVSACVTEFEELSAQVIEQQTVYKEDSITQLQVPVSTLEHSLHIHIESPNVCENYQVVVGCDELGSGVNVFSGLSPTSQVNELCALQKDTVSAYVTESKEFSSQVVGLDDSHLEQIFDNGFQTELKKVLKLKESMGLENPKKSRCLKASRFNFKRKKKRIKSLFNTLSCGESWRKHMHENLQIVSGLVGFNVGDFRCHKEYGLARMGNWSQIRVEYSLLEGELFGKNTLPREPATSSSMFPLYVADPVSLQLIHDNLKSHLWHKWKSKLLLHSGFDGNKLTQSHKLKIDKTELQLDQSDITLVGLKVEIASLMEVDCVLAECMMHTTTVISAKLYSLFSFEVDTAEKLAAPLLKVLKSWMFKYKPQLVWAEWLRHKVTMISAMLPATIRGCYSWYGWRVFDRGKDNIIPGDVPTLVFWVVTFVHLSPSFKLEDKLVLQGESIDTILQSYLRKKKKLEAQQELTLGADDVAATKVGSKDSEWKRGFAVTLRGLK